MQGSSKSTILASLMSAIITDVRRLVLLERFLTGYLKSSSVKNCLKVSKFPGFSSFRPEKIMKCYSGESSSKRARS
jgi:hypothetical protein